MSASPDPSAAPEPRISRRRRFGGVSAAWFVPLLALAIAGALAWRHYATLGPEITIRFANGAGLEAGRTAIRYRDVEIGVIEALGFSEDLGSVVATAQMGESVEGRLTEDTTFWVVRAQVGPTGVSGLGTLLSGAYVEAELGDPEAPEQDVFVALDEPPITPAGAPGRRVTLSAERGGSLFAGAPVFYKSFEVGRVETKRLSEDGSRILFDAFIRAPFDARLSEATRFWNASGVSLSLGPEGVEIDVASLASFGSLLLGGVVFDDFGGPGAAGPALETYRLYTGEQAARDSLFGEDPEQQIRLTVAFGESVRGLQIGAPVEYRGVRIGEVEDVLIRAEGASLDRLVIVATLLLQPGRLGLEGRGPSEYVDFFERSVERGLRARLASGNIVTGSLYVQLTDVPNAMPASLDLDAEPYPRLPTTPSTLDEIRSTAEEVLARVAELPIEDLLARAIGVLANLEAVTASEGLQEAPAQLAETLETARALLESLEEAGVAGSIASAAGSAEAAAQSARLAAASLPELIERLSAAAAQAEQAVSAYSGGSTLNSEAVAALREVRQAARAVSSLAQALERSPNSLILGR